MEHIFSDQPSLLPHSQGRRRQWLALLREHASTSLGLWISHAFNVLFHLLLIAHTTPEQFGEVATVLSLGFLGNTGQATMKNYIIALRRKYGSHDRLILSRALHAAVLLSIFTIGAFALLSPLLRVFLHFSAVSPFLLLGVSCNALFFNGIIRGFLSIQKRFSALGFSFIAETFPRLPFLYLFLRDGYQPTDTPWILVLSGVFLLLAGVLLLGPSRALLHAPFQRISRTHALTTSQLEIFSFLFSNLCIGALMRMDVLWAKHALPAEAAGTYGMLSTIALLLTLATSGITQTSLVYVRPATMKSIFSKINGIFLAATASACVVFLFAGDPLIGYFLGERYTGHTQLLFMFFVAAAANSSTAFSAQCMFILSTPRRTLLCFLAFLVQGIGILALGSSLVTLSLVHMFVLLLCASMFARLLLAGSTFHRLRRVARGRKI